MRLVFGFLWMMVVAGAQNGGLPAPWDVRKTVDSLKKYLAESNRVLDQVQPQQWMAQGAPDAYVSQHQQVRTQIRSLDLLLGDAQKDPERLTLVMDIFFRLETLDLSVGSLAEGIRRYQNPAVAELLFGLRNESAAARTGFRQYLLELAETREQEMKIMDREAQKCRGEQLKRPPRR